MSNAAFEVERSQHGVLKDTRLGSVVRSRHYTTDLSHRHGVIGIYK